MNSDWGTQRRSGTLSIGNRIYASSVKSNISAALGQIETTRLWTEERAFGGWIPVENGCNKTSGSLPLARSWLSFFFVPWVPVGSPDTLYGAALGP